MLRKSISNWIWKVQSSVHWPIDNIIARIHLASRLQLNYTGSPLVNIKPSCWVAVDPGVVTGRGLSFIWAFKLLQAHCNKYPVIVPLFHKPRLIGPAGENMILCNQEALLKERAYIRPSSARQPMKGGRFGQNVTQLPRPHTHLQPHTPSLTLTGRTRHGPWEPCCHGYNWQQLCQGPGNSPPTILATISSIILPF